MVTVLPEKMTLLQELLLCASLSRMLYSGRSSSSAPAPLLSACASGPVIVSIRDRKSISVSRKGSPRRKTGPLLL